MNNNHQTIADAYNPAAVFGRFLKSIAIAEDGCWNWTQSRNNSGYGSISIMGGLLLTHRYSHELFIGRIPDGFEVDHLCKNRACANPRHLEAVTSCVNMQRAKGRDLETVCVRGHVLAVVGVYRRLRRRRDGTEVLRSTCKPCHTDYVARYHAKRGF